MPCLCGVGRLRERGVYQGDGLGLVDDKGRVAIPASLRSTLAGNAPRADGKDGGSVIIGVHEDGNCLVAYDPGFQAILRARLNEQEAQNPLAGGRRNHAYKREAAIGEAVPFDGSGRFIMPAFPRDEANIGTNAFFYGTFDLIEIWDPATLLADEGMPNVVKNCCRFHCRQKGIVL